ncbi:biopolymer transport protein ExbD [Pirellula sp. SH-Sr6A]|uniref:ExbD/TolR family protein n=1 Tax=Pirellula sp. SH-Sr6A TaxID=1632865 RepID=UPI00078B70D5|nr:biopolymer transporter ExbD [Pirellula sp. SH-Sr6A]AMV34528.1 biopolymer transport protein ExbD [Pirellula sp. SH-Sr6A]
MPISIRKGKALESLNLTPLIDVVFLLLIFFLVATRFAQEDRELAVQLPSAANALPMTLEPNELVVHVDRQGIYTVNGKTLNLRELEVVLRQSVADNPIGQVVIIRADKSAEVQTVVYVMDLCTKLCVPKYKIATEPEPEP